MTARGVPTGSIVANRFTRCSDLPVSPTLQNDGRVRTVALSQPANKNVPTGPDCGSCDAHCAWLNTLGIELGRNANDR